MNTTVKRYLAFKLSEDAALSKENPAEFKGIARGSKDYLRIRVSVPEQFKAYSMAAIYSGNGSDYPRPVVNDEADVPNEVTQFQHFTVKLVLQNGGQRIYTNGIEVYQSGKYDA